MHHLTFVGHSIAQMLPVGYQYRHFVRQSSYSLLLQDPSRSREGIVQPTGSVSCPYL